MSERPSAPWNPDLTDEDRARIEVLKAEFPHRVAALKMLREALGLSQAELADMLGRTQSSVSKLEAKGDVRLGELKRAVEAKGGRLRVTAEIDGRELELPLPL